jgi:hypothetical protein
METGFIEKKIDNIKGSVVKKSILRMKRLYGQEASHELVVVEQKERRGLPVIRP